MGLFGGSKSYSGSAQKWAQPFAKSAASDAQNVFNSAQPMNQQLTQTITSRVPGLASMFDQGSPTVKAAQGYATDVLGGKYMTGNPWLEPMIAKMRRGVTDTVNGQFTAAGRYGSGAHTGVLADRLAEAEAGLRFNDYNTQQGRMDAMTGMAPTLAQSEYIGLPELLQTAQMGAELPYAGLVPYTSSLANLFSGGTQKSSGGILGGLGGLASGIGSMGQAGMFK